MAKAVGAGGLKRRRGARNDATGPIWIDEIHPDLRAEFDRLKRELRVLDTAQEEGRRNSPSTRAKDMNASQIRIIDRVATGVRELNAYVAEQIGRAAAAAQNRAPQPLGADEGKAEIDRRISDVLVERRSDLVALREQELETLRDLNYFRRRHGLHRAAAYRESTLLFFAILVGMFVIESFANAFLLRRISEQGWVGGVVLAGVISMVNIGLGILAGGVGWRLIGHRFAAQKAIGWAVALAAAVLAFFWNLFAAHFREVAETAATSGSVAIHATDALAHIHAHGLFGLTTIFSWGLFALGVLVHLAAAREAWDDMADRYWDYRRYDKAYRLARDDYEGLVAEAKAEAGIEAREALGVFEAAHTPQAQERDRLAAVSDLAQRRLAEARDAEAEWYRQGEALIRAYRDENAHVRTDRPPGYFEREPDLKAYLLTVSESGPMAEAASDADASRRQAERACQQIREAADRSARLQSENATVLNALRKYVTEAVFGLQERIEGLRETVDKEADASLARRVPELASEDVDGA